MFSFIKSIFNTQEKTIYKYQGLPGEKYPSAEITFLIDGINEPFKAFIIIDSGADISVIPKTIGESISLKKTQLHYLGGIGGRIGYYINHVNVELADKKITIPVAWITNDNSPLLLGRKGVFDKFRICFNEKKGVVEFTQ